ncbi:hypothetical protein AAHA92_12972 [Salvia divinorum]|uniref:Uncharacterized protein n=1 Tax=Salvia divinorum TaxID=28513 RepID=A0ABD1H6V1_SALDI
MDPKSEIHATEHREGALSEVRNGNISGRVEVSNGLGSLAEANGHFWDPPASKIPELMKSRKSPHTHFSLLSRGFWMTESRKGMRTFLSVSHLC